MPLDIDEGFGDFGDAWWTETEPLLSATAKQRLWGCMALLIPIVTGCLTLAMVIKGG